MTDTKSLFIGKKRYIRNILFLVGIFFIFLDSYNILDIPLPWIGFIVCVLSCITNQIMHYHKLFWSMISLICVLIITTYVGYDENSASLKFILLRFTNIIGLVIIVNYFANLDYESIKNSILENNLINLGLFFSLVALVILILQIFNIHEINIFDHLKNRLTTGAGENYSSKYNYNFDPQKIFYRASGTFREPSLLVNALILPFFLAIKNKNFFAILIIGLTIYLTYSLAILAAILFGLIFSLLVIYRTKLFNKNFILCFIFFILSIYIFYKFGLFEKNVYGQRLFHLFENDSRDYIYNNLDIILGNYLIGNGIGYGFFELTQQIFGNRIIPTSFLSVPLNFWSSGGIIGLLIISFWIFSHNIMTIIFFDKFNKTLYLLITPLNIFLILYLSSFEELHIWHAIGLGFFLSYLKDFKKLKKLYD